MTDNRAALLILGGIAVLIVAVLGLLAYQGTPLPDGLLTLAGVPVGALATYLTGRATTSTSVGHADQVGPIEAAAEYPAPADPPAPFLPEEP